ncbi:MAG: low molecular weight phosphotyrosine protein phosphatase [Ruminococcaceae bacterium]|nr:low molecular weight phosphotyrosine protein phosphatase [Oscillospiraceae bacterium]
MQKILFVCHGNICRSPMAEFLFREYVTKLGRGAEFHIESAATSTEEIGNPVYPPAARILRKRGIDCSAKRARQLRASDRSSWDYFIGMDSRNIANMRRILGPDAPILRLLDMTEHPRDIADPWYTDNFDETLADVLEGCEALLAWLDEQR